MKASGNLNVIELPAITRWTRTGGKTLIRRWTGPSAFIGVAGSESPAGTKTAQLTAAGIEHEVEREPGKLPVVSATYAGDENQDPNTALSDQWILDINELEKNIWELPVIVDEFAKSLASAHPPLAPTVDDSAYAVCQLKRDIKSLINGDQIEHDGTFLGFPDIYATAVLLNINVALLKQFVADLTKGVESFELDQFVIRRTRVVTEATAITALDQNVRKMISTSSMIAIEGAPPKFPVIGDIPVGFWLKKRPKAEPATPGRWTIHQEYWHSDKFSELIYGKAI